MQIIITTNRFFYLYFDLFTRFKQKYRNSSSFEKLPRHSDMLRDNFWMFFWILQERPRFFLFFSVVRDREEVYRKFGEQLPFSATIYCPYSHSSHKDSNNLLTNVIFQYICRHWDNEQEHMFSSIPLSIHLSSTACSFVSKKKTHTWYSPVFSFSRTFSLSTCSLLRGWRCLRLTQHKCVK